MYLQEDTKTFEVGSITHYLVTFRCSHDVVVLFVPVVLVVVVDSKHNRNKVSFHVMENEIVREEIT
jgi:hypothetical protein